MFQPILDRVLVRRIDDEEKSSIITPDIAKEKSNKGRVVAIGKFFQHGGRSFPISDFVNVGDTVLVSEFNYQPVQIDGEELVLVRVADILGVEAACGDSAELNASSALTTTVNA